MNVYIVNGSGAYVKMFSDMGHNVVLNKDIADIACFTGGEDVSPHLYGDHKHKFTGNNEARDEYEKLMFQFFKNKNIPMVGICRGGQFLNVMSGGRMYQHVTKHCGDHEITDSMTGDTLLVSSTHHQMFMPSPEAVLVAFSTLGGTREWYDGEVFMRDVSNTDYEVLFYPHTNCLCFQPHPEFVGYPDMRKYFSDLVDSLLVATSHVQHV